MDSQITKRDEEEWQEELRANAEYAIVNEADDALTAIEERGIMEAMASIEAGHGLPFEEVMLELERATAREQLNAGLVEAEHDVATGKLISHDDMDAQLAAWARNPWT